MVKKVIGHSSPIFKNLSDREMNFLDQYIQYRRRDGSLDWMPEWFYDSYDGEIRSMSPIVLTYFLAELVGQSFPHSTASHHEKSEPIQLVPGWAEPDEESRELGFSRGRAISHREAGIPPIPRNFEDDPDPWKSYSQDLRYYQEMQRIYYKLAAKMRRRYPRDVEECDMHAKRHLDDEVYESHSEWKEVALEGKKWRSPAEKLRDDVLDTEAKKLKPEKDRIWLEKFTEEVSLEELLADSLEKE